MVHKHFNVIINLLFLFFFLSSLNPGVFYPLNHQENLNDSILPGTVKINDIFDRITLDDQKLISNFEKLLSTDFEIGLDLKKEKSSSHESLLNEISDSNFPPDFRPKLQNGGGDMYSVTLNKTGRNVFVKDGFAYVADSESGIAIINVTDPSNPGPPMYSFLKGGNDVAEDIFVKDGFAYVAYATEGLAVFNVSDPLNPGNPVYKALPGNTYAETVFVEGNYAYVAGDNVYIFDVSNPLNPGNPVTINTGGNPHGIYVRDNLAYISAENNGLAIINVTNPSSPTTISEENIGNCWCEDIYLKGNYAYLASGSDGLAVIDISNPLNPGPPSYVSVSGTSNEITAFGDYVFMTGSSTSLGLSMFNIEDPTNPKGPIYKFTGGSNVAHGVFVDGDYAYVTEGSVAIGSRLLIIEWAPILLTPSNNSTISDSTPDLDWKDVTDASYYHVQVADSGDFSNITSETNISSSSWTISPPLSSGVYYWRVSANDSLDKWGAWSPARQFEVDIDLPPNINLLTPSNNTIQPYSSKIQLDITDSNLDTVLYNWDNGTNQTLSSPWQINLTLSEGWHNLHIYANDTNGFTSSKFFRFYCDPTPPIILLQTPLNNTIHQSGKIIDIDIIDNNSVSVFYHWDANANQSWVDPYLTSLPVGETNHVLHVYVNDTAGNSNYNQYIFTTDDTIPLITLISPINDTFIPSSIIIDLDISDINPFSHVLYAWGLDPWTPLNSPYDVPLPGSDGIYALHVYANDTADNWDYKYFLFGIDGTSPAIILE